jgi:hypothetical protein
MVVALQDFKGHGKQVMITDACGCIHLPAYMCT